MYELTLEKAINSEPTFVEFEDGSWFIAPLQSFTLLDGQMWELVNHKPLKDVEPLTEEEILADLERSYWESTCKEMI